MPDRTYTLKYVVDDSGAATKLQGIMSIKIATSYVDSLACIADSRIV